MRTHSFEGDLPSLQLTGEEFSELVDILFPDAEEEEPPSLYDILDLEADAPLAAAVDTLFPPDQLGDAVVPGSPEGTCDSLACEERFSPSPLGTATGPSLEEVPEVVLNTEFELDHPEVPGVNCKSCEFHRRKAKEDGTIHCSLCYMRRTGDMILSKCSKCLCSACWW
uniref:E1A protein n=1 Tax=Pipistrellus pipistrellus adenovirus TaxID=3140007 RepID=A0AAU6S526_9ADEN